MEYIGLVVAGIGLVTVVGFWLLGSTGGSPQSTGIMMLSIGNRLVVSLDGIRVESQIVNQEQGIFLEWWASIQHDTRSAQTTKPEKICLKDKIGQEEFQIASLVSSGVSYALCGILCAEEEPASLSLSLRTQRSAATPIPETAQS